MAVTPHITIVGCGPGAADYLTPAAIRAAEEAEVLVGARRLLDLFPDHPGEKIEMRLKTEEVLEAISRRDSQKIAVLVTGDPGISSLAEPVIHRFGLDRCRVIPGISSIQTAFARLGLSWLDAKIVNAHGKDPSLPAGDLKGGSKFAVLGGRSRSFEWLQKEWGPRLKEYRVIICEDLTLPDERITTWEPGTVLERPLSSRTIFLLVRK